MKRRSLLIVGVALLVATIGIVHAQSEKLTFRYGLSIILTSDHATQIREGAWDSQVRVQFNRDAVEMTLDQFLAKVGLLLPKPPVWSGQFDTVLANYSGSGPMVRGAEVDYGVVNIEPNARSTKPVWGCNCTIYHPEHMARAVEIDFDVLTTGTATKPVLAQDAKQVPKYVLVWRVKVGQAQRPWATEVMPFQSIEQALAYAEEKELTDEQFIGIWRLGDPVNVSVSTKEETVRRSKREWKKAP